MKNFIKKNVYPLAFVICFMLADLFCLMLLKHDESKNLPPIERIESVDEADIGHVLG